MNILISTLKEELSTVKRLEQKYLKELNKIPKGSFIIREKGNRNYGYLTYRDGSKVKQKYLGLLDSESLKYYKDLAMRKKELKRKLKSILEQKRILERALRAKTK